jgi:formylglycine-generating enzyme required for sulfatase activity
LLLSLPLDRLDLVLIPAGEFVRGDTRSTPEALRAGRAVISRPFWMAKMEVCNEQFAQFDPRHDSRLESGDFLQFSVQERGYPVNSARQPVVRVSWAQAVAFCQWLSELTGEVFTLPDETQWEYACRAGSDTDLWFGGLDADFSPYANLADASYRKVDTFGWGLPSGAIPPWRPAAAAVNDRHRVSAPVGSYKPNAWGLHDMHGNAAEWTATDAGPGRKVVRGGAWSDRPAQARSAARLAYPAWQRVYNVGFRVVAGAAPARKVAMAPAEEK